MHPIACRLSVHWFLIRYTGLAAVLNQRNRLPSRVWKFSGGFDNLHRHRYKIQQTLLQSAALNLSWLNQQQTVASQLTRENRSITCQNILRSNPQTLWNPVDTIV